MTCFEFAFSVLWLIHFIGLLEYVSAQAITKLGYTTMVSVLKICKCVDARIWWDDEHVAKQIEQIDPVISAKLVAAGFTSFAKLLSAPTYQIDSAVKRNAPFGKNLQQEISEIACFKLSVSQNLCLESANSTFDITISSNNTGKVAKKDGAWMLIIGDADDRIVFREKIRSLCRGLFRVVSL